MAGLKVRKVDTSVPATAGGLDAEWGPALEDVRHRLFGFGRASLGAGFSLSMMGLYETGALEPVAALAIVTMVIITAAIALATRLGRGSARRASVEGASVAQ